MLLLIGMSFKPNYFGEICPRLQIAHTESNELKNKHAHKFNRSYKGTMESFFVEFIFWEGKKKRLVSKNLGVLKI
jgi:hypothetical protein